MGEYAEKSIANWQTRYFREVDANLLILQSRFAPQARVC
jgi:hypothetical protein